MKIREKFEARLKKAGAAMEAFPWSDRAAYANWLAQTFHYVSHSTRLLALGASRFDVAADALHQRFLKHASEEKHHEFLAMRDVTSLGYTLSDLPALPETKAFYQCQYYWIQNVDPRAFFGYIVALEGLAVLKGSFIHAQAKAAHGGKGLSFVKTHAEDDPEHLEAAYAFVDKFPEETQRLIYETFEQSCSLYEHMLGAIAREAGVSTPLSRAA